MKCNRKIYIDVIYQQIYTEDWNEDEPSAFIIKRL